MGAIYVGDVVHKGYFLDLGRDPTDRVPFDFSTVVGATLIVRRPDRVETIWAAVISNQTPTGLSLAHLFAAGDLPMAGNYTICPRLHMSDGWIDGEPRTLPVRHRFATSP